MQGQDGVDDGHFEQIRHEIPPSAGSAERVNDESSSPQNGWFSSAHHWLVLSAR
jgi:hypothetical protein